MVKLKKLWRNEMMEKLKKHILSQYAKVVTLEQNKEKDNLHTEEDKLLNQKYNVNISSGTIITETMESSDADEFQVGSTFLTHSIEASDPDEFFLCGNSIETRVVEISDLDEFKLGATMLDFTNEMTDKDELLQM